MRSKKKWLLGMSITVFFLLGFFASGAKALDYDYWPLWPVPSYYPEPPKVIYWNEDEEEAFEIVSDANSTEPLTFFSVGRDMMAWGDRMPMIAGELVKIQGNTYYMPLDTEILPIQAWASRMELMDVDPVPVIRKPDLPSNIPIYIGLPSGRKNLTNLTPEDLQIGSLIPEFVASWYDTNNDGVPDGKNQEFTATLNDNWKSFLQNYQFLENLNLKTLEGGDDLFISDAGHSAPVVVWPDNIWLGPMTGWQSFYESLNYENFGGAITFFATNDGKVRAFSVGDEDGSSFQELWSFIPSPALLVTPYHEYWKTDPSISKEPRLIALDGQILIHDIEDQGSSNVWKRILFGSMGQGSFLQYKPEEIWNPAIPDASPPSGIRGDLFGFYALDVTNPSDPKPFWSVSTAEWKDKDNLAKDLMWVDGDLVSSPPLGYSDYQGFRMSVSRPVVGYTYDSGSRIWHLILLGINSQGKYVLYDIDASNGKCRGKYVLGDVYYYEGSDGISHPNDIVKPSRIAAASMLPGDYPGGTYPYTPLLGEVYIYLSNGTLYKWNLQAGESPTLLLTLRGGQSDEVAIPLQDFDLTYLYVPEDTSRPHRFLAAVSAFSKNGSPSDVLETDHYGLIVIDITQLEKESSPPTLTLGSNAFGQTNTVLEPTSYLDFTYLSMRSVDEDAIEIGSAQGSHWKTAFPSSSPIFYDEKVVLITRSYWIKKQGNPGNQDAWSRTYVVDPIGDTVQKLDVRGVTHLGGALIDEEAMLYLQTNQGVLSQDLQAVFGLEPPSGEGTGEGEDNLINPGDDSVIYWKVNS